MRQLFLEDLAGYMDEEVRGHIENSYEVSREEVDKYDILIAYESVGSYGCDSSSYFLLKHKDSGVLYETFGSHCSCYGFEGQFQPEVTSIEYLRSDKFNFYNGGYDGDPESNRQAITDYVQSDFEKEDAI